MKVNKLMASAVAVGVKNRCRKIERHHFSLGTHDTDASQESLADTAVQRIRQGMKSVSKAYLDLTPCEVDDESGIMTVCLSLLGSNGNHIDLMPRLEAQ